MAELTLGDLGEDEVISRLTATLQQGSQVLAGVGDDCAVVKGPATGEVQLLKTDAVVEGLHFTAEEDPQRIGWKALARVISDVASMGGRPDCALVTLVAPKTTSFARVAGIYQGLERCARAFGVSIVGGETTGGPGLLLSITLTGIAKSGRWISRDQAQRGDAIFVTGELGRSIHGHHLDFVPRLEEAQWLVQAGPPTAMMDLSDGLAKDLPRLARASKLAFHVDVEALPRRNSATIEEALGDGEDYELLFTYPQAQSGALLEAWSLAFPQVALTRIGEMLELWDSRATPVERMRGGWDHYTTHSC